LPELLPLSAADSVESWVVEWDPAGAHVAVWVADAGSQTVGVVSLFAIDRGSGLVATNGPLFAARGLPSVQFDAGLLVYTTPSDGGDGKTYLVPVPQTPATPSPSLSPSPSPSSIASEVASQNASSGSQPSDSPTDGTGS
jgi:hypothetical protein